MKSSSRIDLMKGWPNPSLLPPQILSVAAGQALKQDIKITTEILEYGADEGYLPLREEVAKWLTSFYSPKEPISHHRICISGGASQNMASILQVMTDPVYTRNIWMVAPTYYLACRIFNDSGFDGRLKAVPEDDEGINLEYLRTAIQASEERAVAEGNVEPKFKKPKPWRKIYKHVIYAVPTFANPSGRIMSLRRRQGLVRLAREFDTLIVTDDVYDMLQWPSSSEAGSKAMDKAILPRLVDVDRYLDGGPTDKFGNAVSNGSFSKIIGPGCRTGWAEGTENMAWGISQVGSSRSGGAPSQLVASFIHNMLVTQTLSNHIYQELQPAYARRYHNLLAAIEAHLLPLGVTMPHADKDVAGGYFLWLTLPAPLNASRVWKRASEEEDLTVIAGAKFRVEGDEDNEETRFERDIRLCFAWEALDLLQEGVIRLSRVVKRELAEAS